MTKTDNGVSWLHRLASLLAVVTFLVFMTGMLASGAGTISHAAHLANAGSSGGTSSGPLGKYAHIYQVFAVAAIILTIIVALLLSRSAFRKYIKVLGGVTLGVLIAVVITVLSAGRSLPASGMSFGYMCGIQVFFCLTVCLALFTRSDWRWDEPKTADVASPSVRQILVFTTVVIFLQPLLGEAFQQREMGIAPHFVLGIVVMVCAMWVLEMGLTKFAHLRFFKISTIFLAEFVGLEFFLGIVSYSMNLNARHVAGSQPGLAVMNATHAAVGALVLATSLFATFQAFKYFAPAGSKVFSSSMAGEAQQTEPERD